MASTRRDHLVDTALQLFQAGSASGFGQEGSAAMVKLYERLSGREEGAT